MHGAIDCTHFDVQRLFSSGTDAYFNRYGRYSIVGEFVVGPTGQIYDVHLAPGSQDDLTVLRSSPPSQRLLSGQLLAEPLAYLDSTSVQGYLVGDRGYSHM